MTIPDQITAARLSIFNEIDRLGSRAQRAQHEIKNSLNRSSGQIYRRAVERQLKMKGCT